jgi:hypothetical protein
MKKVFVFILLGLLSVACQPGGPSAEQQAATLVAQTAVAAASQPTATQTALPTETPAPLPTETPIPPPPTETPAPTPTAGPVVFKDDFSVKSDAWGACEKCDWRDGALFFGPYPPHGDGMEQLHYVTCEACGEHAYYRVSVEVTFAEGQAGDRIFGLLAALTGDKVAYGVGVSPYKWGGFEIYDFKTQQWDVPQFNAYSAIKAGRTTNQLIVERRPSSSSGTADYYVTVNGKVIITISGQNSKPAKTGLYLEWHSVGASYDNFEYEEIVH